MVGISVVSAVLAVIAVRVPPIAVVCRSIRLTNAMSMLSSTTTATMTTRPITRITVQYVISPEESGPGEVDTVSLPAARGRAAGHR